MKHFTGVMMCLVVLVTMTSTAQPYDDETDAFQLTVVASSAMIRDIPSTEGEFVASVFRDDRLEAVGRNMNGRWLLIRRVGRMNNLGWIASTLVDLDFRPETLPLVEFSTGVDGDFKLTNDPGFAAFTLAEVNLRTQPSEAGEVITRVPFGTVLPVLERDQIGTWFLANYHGTPGWVNAINLRGVENSDAVPIASGLPEIPVANALIIPLDVQIDEIQEFRDYVTAQNEFAEQIAVYWSAVLDYEAMPCEPPDFVTNYQYGEADERAFPELYYLVPRLGTAIDFVNDAIDPMYVCGVKRPQLVLNARNAALNASIVYEATLNHLDNIEAQITRGR